MTHPQQKQPYARNFCRLPCPHFLFLTGAKEQRFSRSTTVDWKQEPTNLALEPWEIRFIKTGCVWNVFISKLLIFTYPPTFIFRRNDGTWPCFKGSTHGRSPCFTELLEGVSTLMGFIETDLTWKVGKWTWKVGKWTWKTLFLELRWKDFSQEKPMSDVPRAATVKHLSDTWGYCSIGVLWKQYSHMTAVSCKHHGNLRYPPQSYPPPRNKALIAGLIKGNQWLIVP